MNKAEFALWALNTTFGKIVFFSITITWMLVMINLFLLMVFLVHKIFGSENPVKKGGRKLFKK